MQNDLVPFGNESTRRGTAETISGAGDEDATQASASSIGQVYRIAS